jgi:hypothetical protein
MSSLSSRSDIAGTPSNATAKSALTALYDFLAQRLAAGTSGAGTATAAELQTSRESLGILIPRGHIAGLALSTAGSSATFSVAAGQAADDGNAVLVTLASAISKTTGSWAVGSGNGGLDTGSIANSTWYHAWLIRRPDTGVVDVLVSLSATSPTMPGGGAYTQKRRIGSLLTNGSAQWVRFVQRGDDFLWFLPVLDVSSSANPGASAFTPSISVPSGVNVKARLQVNARNSGTGVYVAVYVSSPDVSDDSPSETLAPLATAGWSDGSSAGNRSNANPVEVWTNTSRQVRWRINSSDASVNVYLATLGWTDLRGREA